MDLKCEGKEGVGLETLQWIHTYKSHIYLFIHLFIYLFIHLFLYIYILPEISRYTTFLAR